MGNRREIIWVGDSLKILQGFPEDIKDEIGYALYLAQNNENPTNTKQLKGIKPAVIEIIASDGSGTYRAVYTLKISEIIYVLHCFQKKSKRGIKTPQQEVELIKQRLRQAEVIEKVKGVNL